MHLVVVRHARSSANADGILAGRKEGIHLDEKGRAQAETLAMRFEGLADFRIVGSPITRCRETAEAICIQHRIAYEVDDRLSEVEYGNWSGRALSELSEDPMWRQIQDQPTSVTFPNGESFTDVFDRTRAFLSSMQELEESQVVVAFTHGDIAKALLAHALASPLDQFQRIVVDPCSVSVIRIQSEKSFVLRMNDTGASLLDMLGSTNAGVVGGGK